MGGSPETNLRANHSTMVLKGFNSGPHYADRRQSLDSRCALFSVRLRGNIKSHPPVLYKQHSIAVQCFMSLYNAIQCFMVQKLVVVQCLILLYNALRCYTTLYKALCRCTMLYNAIQCFTMLCNAMQCYTMLYFAIQCFMVCMLQKLVAIQCFMVCMLQKLVAIQCFYGICATESCLILQLPRQTLAIVCIVTSFFS